MIIEWFKRRSRIKWFNIRLREAREKRDFVKNSSKLVLGNFYVMKFAHYYFVVERSLSKFTVLDEKFRTEHEAKADCRKRHSEIVSVENVAKLVRECEDILD